MNIAMVPRRFVRTEWGGTETVVLQTSKTLKSLGHEVKIVCPNALADTNHEVVEGVEVVRVPYFYPYWGLKGNARTLMDKKGGNMFSFSLLRALLRSPKLDLIHLHTLKRVGGIGRHAARRRRIPYLVTLHGGVHDVPGEEAASWTEPAKGSVEWGKALGWWVGSRRVLDDAAAIICVGEEERRKTQAAYPGKRVLFLPNGVDSGHFSSGDGAGFRRKHGIPEGAPLLLNVGRIDAQKNQRLLLEALSMVLPDNPDARLLLIGHVTNEEYGALLRREISERGISGNVTLIPGLPADSGDLVDAYHAADLFVLPSSHEPFGIVILEAWAAGLAVVASRVGGVPAFVEDGRDGLLVESGDVAGFASAIRGCLKNPELARALSKRGREKACNQYSWESVSAKLEILYREALDENPLRK